MQSSAAQNDTQDRDSRRTKAGIRRAHTDVPICATRRRCLVSVRCVVLCSSRQRITADVGEQALLIRRASQARLTRRGVGLSVAAYGNEGEGTVMAYGIVHHFPGGTKENYEASIAAVHPSDGSLPEGQVFHAAGPSAGGWTILAVHESKESWERFRDGTLMPRMQQGIEGGFPTPPEETAIDLYKVMP
jgi:hypothetical protein